MCVREREKERERERERGWKKKQRIGGEERSGGGGWPDEKGSRTGWKINGAQRAKEARQEQ